MGSSRDPHGIPEGWSRPLGRVGDAKEPLSCQWKGKSSVVSDILVALEEWGRLWRGIATLEGQEGEQSTLG